MVWQLSHGDGTTPLPSRAKLNADDEDEDDEDEVSQGRRSNSRTPPPPPPTSKSRDGVRLSVTSPPPAFANPAGALSPPQASVISPFGSPSGWISGQQQEAAKEGATAVDKTSNVHINGDHVTQVRVDAIVLTPSTSQRRNHRQKQTEVVQDDDDDYDDGSSMSGRKEQAEEDRDQSELLVTTRLAVSNPPSARDQTHVTAVQVEHTSSNAHQDPT